MVRQWQTLFYNQRYSNTVLHAGAGRGTVTQPERQGHPRPGLREAVRGHGLRRHPLRGPGRPGHGHREANAINDRPVVVDFIVHEDAMVWPMVAAGTSNDEIMAARGVRPDFGDNEDD